MQHPTSDCLLFVTGRNCELYVAECLRSIARQSLQDLHVLFIDDASDDDTTEIARQHLTDLFPGRHTFIRNETRFGKARSAWEHLRPRAGNATFITVVDSDDQLIDPTILSTLSSRYVGGKDVVWTNYVTDNGMQGGSSALDPLVSPRQQGWRTSHLFSFRALLLTTVPEDYFKNSAGQWYQAACDIALALPILDQTRRYEFIPKLAYRYTATNPYSHHNLDPNSVGLNSQHQQKSAGEIFRKPSLPRRDEDRQTARAADVATVAVAPSPWDQKAIDLIFSRFPLVINAIDSAARHALTPLEILSLCNLTSQVEPMRLLHLGNPASALITSAIAASRDNCAVTCMTAGTDSRSWISQRARLGGYAGPLRFLGVEQIAADADPSGSAANGYNFLILDARGAADEPAFLESGLSSTLPLLDPEFFMVVAITSTLEASNAGKSRWDRLNANLESCVGAIAGSFLVGWTAN